MAQLLLIYRCGGSAGIVVAVVITVAFTGFPVSLGQPWAAEHLKQAAKVRGLGVERQLKSGLRC